MFTTILNRFNRQRGKARTLVAVAVCVAGMALGAGGGSLIAGGGEPGVYSCCDPNIGCSSPCQNYGNYFWDGSSDMVAIKSPMCTTHYELSQTSCGSSSSQVLCGQINIYTFWGCMTGLEAVKPYYAASCASWSNPCLNSAPHSLRRTADRIARSPGQTCQRIVSETNRLIQPGV